MEYSDDQCPEKRLHCSLMLPGYYQLLDMALVTQYIVNASQRRQRRHCSSHSRREYSNPIVVTRWSASVIKVSGCLHSSTFKRKEYGPALQHVIISACYYR